MVTILLQAIILAIVLYAVYYVFGLFVVAVGLPSMITVIVGLLLVLGFAFWILRAFGFGV